MHAGCHVFPCPCHVAAASNQASLATSSTGEKTEARNLGNFSSAQLSINDYGRHVASPFPNIIRNWEHGSDVKTCFIQLDMDQISRVDIMIPAD